jgi:predicted small secreted protein
MTTTFKRITLLLVFTAILVTAGSGCNTAEGFGKDMEKTGEKIQDGVK